MTALQVKDSKSSQPVPSWWNYCLSGWTVVPPLAGPELDAGFQLKPHCVTLFNSLESWHRAKAICVSYGANLLELNSPHETNQVSKLLTNALPGKVIILPSFDDYDWFRKKKSSESSQVFWMGGNDLATENRWAWASNGRRIYPYVNWASATSTPTGKRCIALKGPDLLWSPEDCQATKARFICEASKHIEYILVQKNNHSQWNRFV